MTNRQIIIDSMASIEELSGLMTDISDDLTDIELHTLNGLANRISEMTARIRYRIGLIQDGKA